MLRCAVSCCAYAEFIHTQLAACGAAPTAVALHQPHLVCVCACDAQGQGMTVGLMGSALLCECIQETLASGGDSREEQQAALDTLPASFHTKLGALVDYPWAISTGPDAAYVSSGPVKVLCCRTLVVMCVHNIAYCKQPRLCNACL